jgi:NitT/TauT family transport system substrate-binding protein
VHAVGRDQTLQVILSLRWLAFAVLLLVGAAASAEEIRVGVVKTSSSGDMFIAAERGYFRDEGLEVSLVPFEGAQPIAVAVVTGDLDIGVSALTAGFYSLAGQGELRLIGGESRDVPTYRYIGYLASNRAFAAGLTAPRALAGHSLAITQIGAPGQYALGRLGEKYGFDVKNVRLVPLYSFPSIVTALAGNRVDAGLLPAAPGLAAVERNAARLIGWVGDETPWQVSGVYTATVTADGREEMLRRFLAASRRGARDYAAAFSAEDGTRRDGPDADAVLAIIAKYTGEPASDIRRAIAYIDPEGRIDAADIARQIAWYKAQHLLKGDLDGAELLDRHYVRTLPE